MAVNVVDAVVMVEVVELVLKGLLTFGKCASHRVVGIPHLVAVAFSIELEVGGVDAQNLYSMQFMRTD